MIATSVDKAYSEAIKSMKVNLCGIESPRFNPKTISTF